jgi:hypothetical protein
VVYYFHDVEITLNRRLKCFSMRRKIS